MGMESSREVTAHIRVSKGVHVRLMSTALVSCRVTVVPGGNRDGATVQGAERSLLS